MAPLTEAPSWDRLTTLAARPRPSLRALFAADPARVTDRTVTVAGLTADLSRHLVDDEVLTALLALADERGVMDRMRRTQAGATVNVTEGRAALHTALRLPREASLVVDGRDVVPDVHDALDRAFDLAEQVRDGRWRGATDQPIRAVVNIGIGGSDLGPRMLHQALADHIDVDIDVRFVSNVDPDDVTTALSGLDPATTLVVVVSKTFSTTETLTNARTARRWLTDALGEDAVARHFVAVSTNAERVAAFGIDTSTMIGFWDWVGGRYSASSAVGLSLLIAIGPTAFRAMLDGMRAVDEHAVSAPVARNLPVLMALHQLWYGSLLGAQSQAILPYSRRLARFPAYLQQLEMESNGKRVTLEGDAVDHATGSIVWGEPGTDGQHAFFQLLHQGTHLVPADLIGVLAPANDTGDHHDQLLANLFAQGQALAFGRTAQEVADGGVDAALVPHRTFPGDRPSTTILLDAITPATVGALVALYEQKVAALAALLGINAYDQWGVELGKVLAGDLIGLLTDSGTPDLSGLDASTRALVEVARRARGRA